MFAHRLDIFSPFGTLFFSLCFSAIVKGMALAQGANGTPVVYS